MEMSVLTRNECAASVRRDALITARCSVLGLVPAPAFAPRHSILRPRRGQPWFCGPQAAASLTRHRARPAVDHQSRAHAQHQCVWARARGPLRLLRSKIRRLRAAAALPNGSRQPRGRCPARTHPRPTANFMVSLPSGTLADRFNFVDWTN